MKNKIAGYVLIAGSVFMIMSDWFDLQFSNSLENVFVILFIITFIYGMYVVWTSDSIKNKLLPITNKNLVIAFWLALFLLSPMGVALDTAIFVNDLGLFSKLAMLITFYIPFEHGYRMLSISSVK